jgi:hypothetical protein
MGTLRHCSRCSGHGTAPRRAQRGGESEDGVAAEISNLSDVMEPVIFCHS